MTASNFILESRAELNSKGRALLAGAGDASGTAGAGHASYGGSGSNGNIDFQQ